MRTCSLQAVTEHTSLVIFTDLTAHFSRNRQLNKMVDWLPRPNPPHPTAPILRGCEPCWEMSHGVSGRDPTQVRLGGWPHFSMQPATHHRNRTLSLASLSSWASTYRVPGVFKSCSPCEMTDLPHMSPGSSPGLFLGRSQSCHSSGAPGCHIQECSGQARLWGHPCRPIQCQVSTPGPDPSTLEWTSGRP